MGEPFLKSASFLTNLNIVPTHSVLAPITHAITQSSHTTQIIVRGILMPILDSTTQTGSCFIFFSQNTSRSCCFVKLRAWGRMRRASYLLCVFEALSVPLKDAGFFVVLSNGFLIKQKLPGLLNPEINKNKIK